MSSKLKPSKRSWAGVYVSVFVLAALGYVFANAWNNFVLAFMKKHAKKDKDGNVINPVDQLFYYALGISLTCGIALWLIYEYINIEQKSIM